jgi:eukaryotic-like serine/threonine-protein kinase
MADKLEDGIGLDLDGEIRRTVSKGRRIHSLVIVAAAIVVFLGVGIIWYLYLHREQRLTEKDSIIIAEFKNDAESAFYGQGLRQALSTQLGQSPYFNIVSTDFLVQTLLSTGKSPYMHLTPDVVRKVCQQTNAKAMIEGSISSAGSQYMIGLAAVNCKTGEIFAKEQSQTGKLSPNLTPAQLHSQVLNALERAAVSLRLKLGESQTSIDAHNAPLTQITSSSINALQAFDTAETAAEASSEWDLAVSLLGSVIAADPEFGKAYALLGTIQMQQGKDEAAMGSFKKAYELRSHLSDPESRAVSMIYYRDCLGDYEKALQIIQQWNQAYPQHALPLLNMGDLYLNRLGRYDQALEPLKESLKVERLAIVYRNAIVACIELNRLDEAKALIKEALDRKVDRSYMQYALYIIASRQNDKAGMAANEAEARRRLEWGSLDNRQDIYKGRLSAIRNSLRSKAVLPIQVVRNSRLLALVGFFDEAKNAAKNLRAISMNREVQGNLAITLALSGDADAAKKMADDLAQRFPEATSTRFCFVPSVQAALALREGKPQQAIDSLASAKSYESVKGSELIVTYLRGEAYLALRQGAQAVLEFQKMIDHPSIDLYDVPRNVLPRLGLARAYAMQGDKTKARTAYQEFLNLWKDADPDIPILKQAKQEYEGDGPR